MMKRREDSTICGIVGHFSLRGTGMSGGDSKTIRELTIAGTVRGYDGTGLLMLDSKSEKLFYRKEAVTASELLDKEDWEAIIGGSRFVIGHNRAATSGSLDADSTHPFINTNVCGVHNGTIASWQSLWPGVEADMDSAALFEALDKTSEDPEEVTKFLEEIPWSGAYSLVWYDNRAKELRFARNKDRPMYIITSDDGIWFGSELPMFEWILRRNRTILHQSIQLDEGTLLCMPISGDVATHHSYETDEWVFNNNSWHGGNANTWKSWDEYQRASVQHYQGNTYDNKQVGKFFDVTDFGELPASRVLDGSREIITDKLIAFVGMDFRSWGNSYFDLEHAISTAIETRYEDNGLGLDNNLVRIDRQLNRMSLSVTIVDIDEQADTFLGYVNLGDEYASVSVKCWNHAMLRDVREALAGDRSVITTPLPLRGARVYHTGQVVPIMGVLGSSGESTLYAGESLTTAAGKELVETYGMNGNPLIKAFASKELEWKDSWAMVALDKDIPF